MLKLSMGVCALVVALVTLYGMPSATHSFGVPVSVEEAGTVHGACSGYIGIWSNGCGLPCVVWGSGVTLKAWITGGPFSVSSASFDCGCGVFGTCAVYGCGS